jgi:pyruvate,water dikinase
MEMIQPSGGSGETAEKAKAPLFRSLWKMILSFLEIIGLRQEQRVEQEAQLARFKLYHAEFRKLLSANNSFLEIITEIEKKKTEGDFFDLPYLKRKIARAVADIHLMVGSINTISSGRYSDLEPALENITSRLAAVMEEPIDEPDMKMVVDLPEISATQSDIVGGKMANLGEISNGLHLPTPDGFAVSTGACHLLFQHGDVTPLIQKGETGLLTADEVPTLSGELRGAILSAAIPPPLEAEILTAYDRLETRLGFRPRLAVRSSALGEDSSLSFAGQFTSVLNVSREELLGAYREVLASLFSPEAIHYRLLHGISGESAAMAVGCISVVDAIASGIVFSNDPNNPEPGQVLVNCVRGLGVTLADGKVSPEAITVSRDAHPRLLSRRAADQALYLICGPGGGLVEKALEPEMMNREILTDDEALQLARWALKLETHFGGPQDIEWAMDATRRFKLLQARPLRMLAQPTKICSAFEGARVLVSGGDVACPGVGAGPAVRLDEDGDINSFPEGGILIARRSSPKFVRLMAKVRAIVTDVGSTTGHMASLAREFRVPALLNTKTATRSIPDGALITVDANGACVYEGVVEEALRQKTPEEIGKVAARPRHENPAMRLLGKVSELIIPLNLTNPRSSRFNVENCRTLHDLTRFIHESSYEEMFRMGEKLDDLRASSYYLDVFLPIDLYIVDLGGGIIAPVKGRKVKRSQVTSIPLAAVLRGMLHEKIPRFGPRPLDISGFFQLMMRHGMNNPEDERTFRDPCYALVSTNYLNYTARVGYHFGVIDAYCSETPNKNYIQFLFRGGAADIVRRSRRAQGIGEILKEYGFSVMLSKDLVNARMGKAMREEIEEHLELIGRLLQFMRQMDMAMVNDETAKRIKDAFLNGDYNLEQINS